MLNSRRNWWGWLRGLGLREVDLPDPSSVALLTDESDLAPAWYGPRGEFQIETGDPEVGELFCIVFFPGPAGARIRPHLTVEDGDDLHHFALAPRRYVDLQPTQFASPVEYVPQHSDQSDPLRSKVFRFVVQDDGLTLPSLVAPYTPGDYSTYPAAWQQLGLGELVKLAATSGAANPAGFPYGNSEWSQRWLAPDTCLLWWARQQLTPMFGVINVHEPGAAKG